MTLGLRLSALIGGMASVACSSTEEPEQRPRGALVDHQKWALLEGADDPFATERPPEVNCPPSEVAYENSGGEEAIEVNTFTCNYVSVGQASLLNVVAGDKIRLRGWRGRSTASGPAEAHIAIMLGETLLFDKTYRIPCSTGGPLCPRSDDPCNDAGVSAVPPCDTTVQPLIEAEADAPKGSLVVFHVHNHGDNRYSLIEMSIEELAP